MEKLKREVVEKVEKRMNEQEMNIISRDEQQ